MIAGKGLGLRREFIRKVVEAPRPEIDFFEIAPENWLGVGGKRRRLLEAVASHTPLIAHGLSLSIGSPAPLDKEFVHRLKHFLKAFEIRLYSDHLSYSSDEGHLYDLMPIPFSKEAVRYVADRVKAVQDILGHSIALENISYYADVSLEMNELDFIQAVLDESDCQLLLDVNNVYVNSVNHGYDASAFIRALPTDRIAYLHIAGHHEKAPDLIIDTHGSPIVEPVWKLLSETYDVHGDLPTLLERDNAIPPLETLLGEMKGIHAIREVKGYT